jgi:signal peptidase I
MHPLLMQLIVVLSWVAIPVALVCVIDDWFFRPRRQIAALPNTVKDPMPLSVAYAVLPVLIGAGVLRLLFADRLDFSAVLVLITVVTGAVWWIDSMVFAKMRASAASGSGKDPAAVSLPGTVDYARSFFPVAAVVLLLRAFVFEPFRIPSDSMMPTLLAGDFIIVNKYAYGLRLPVVNTKFLSIGEPSRGDVIVFRFPRDPSINYIKRLVGLPGDRVVVKDDRLYVNGQAVDFKVTGRYDDGCYVNMQVAEERLGDHVHRTLSCPTPLEQPPMPLAQCNRKGLAGYLCNDSGESSRSGFADFEDAEERVVPEGQYLMIGDNRDNSEDGRKWGYVPENNLVGKATRIWFNFDLQRSGGPMWGRIGSRIE